ncbi:uncharacterized protein K452DRAFT_310993 [Aplosporella prunicola CBS 121167]|uniref:Uncharacterized protein n=1 Tax=Aplosporella prunicola CBS 121167 TaxID=1176127 RepID=A0A6A6B8C7_9PEZI|nr:uncharacterized protein K452DRAFT_310993 [Aplosporella prunicola CBS 121167]KAF2139041.1 hypothetical protein K452DRAFT_310993 [Aplosporella prunicola CBS 121167]
MSAYHQPTVQSDTESDDPPKSNVAVKRSSHSSDLDQPQPDLASDSGYSSRTAATKSTGTDSVSSPTESLPAPKKRSTPAALQEKEKRKDQQRSHSRRPRQDSIVEECAPSQLRLDTSGCHNPNHPTFSSALPSPQYPSSPIFSQLGAHSDTSRPRIYPAGARPASYHGAGSALSDPSFYYSPVSGHGGPPPAMFNHPAVMQLTTYGGQNPHQANGYGLRGPVSPYGPVIHQDQHSFVGGQAPKQNLPDPRYGPTITPAPLYDENPHEWDSEENRRRMPPPALPPIGRPAEKRPSFRGKSQTTASILTRSRLNEQYSDSEHGDDEPFPQGGVARGTSKRRSSVIAHERPQRYLPALKDRKEVVVESSRLGRRATLKDHKEIRRNPYNAIVPSRADQGAGRRRSTDITSPMHDLKLNEQRKERDEKKVRRVEQYQQSVSGPRSNPIDDLVTKRSHAPNEADRSRTSSDDRRSRLSDSQRTTTTRKTNGDMKIHVDADNSIALEFGDSMTDRIIKLRSGDDGNQTIIIEDSNRQKERKYLTEGSRVTTSTATGTTRPRRDTDAGRSRVSNSTRNGERSRDFFSRERERDLNRDHRDFNNRGREQRAKPEWN